MTRRRYRNPGHKRATTTTQPPDEPGDMRGQKDADGPKELSGPLEAVVRLMSLLEMLPDATPPPNLLARTLRRVDREEELSGVMG